MVRIDYREDPNWKAIEAAPKDGTEIQLEVVFPKGLRAYWCDDLKAWVLSRPLTMERVVAPRKWKHVPRPVRKRGMRIFVIQCCARAGPVAEEVVTSFVSKHGKLLIFLDEKRAAVAAIRLNQNRFDHAVGYRIKRLP